MKKVFSDRQVITRSGMFAAVVGALAAYSAAMHRPVPHASMFIDAQNQFSDAQALAATAASTNVIDLGVDRNAGIGEPLAVLITVDVAADAGTGDESYTFDLETDDNSGFASPEILVRRVVSALPNIPRASAAAGFKLVLDVPNDLRCDRFLRLNYTLAGTTPSITVTAMLMPKSMIQAEAVYPKGYTIS